MTLIILTLAAWAVAATWCYVAALRELYKKDNLCQQWREIAGKLQDDNKQWRASSNNQSREIDKLRDELGDLRDRLRVVREAAGEGAIQEKKP